MKRLFNTTKMSILAISLAACTAESQTTEQPWVVDRFDDVKVIRYEVPEFESLPLNEKIMVYYLAESAKYGRDIMFDQNFKYNLVLRRTLESIYEKFDGARQGADWDNFEIYLKKVWFANGVHHHYSNSKFTPKFSKRFFVDALSCINDNMIPAEFGSRKEFENFITELVFNPELYASRLVSTDGVDPIVASANNYYEGVTQAEVEAFYAKMIDPKDKQPISYGLNSKLVKNSKGEVEERVWHIGGMYSSAIEKIVENLEKATEYAVEPQKSTLESLISYYKSGDLRTFDEFNIQWVKDSVSNVDFVNGFTETYGDPLGMKASWESVVNFKDEKASGRTEIISQNAQWFEDHSPIDDKFRKKEVKGVSAKVITVAMLGGDCYPATPIGINLPNADWIRKDHGSKSVTIDNITYAYEKAAHGNGFTAEFVLRAEDRERLSKYGKLSEDLHTDLHECLGHGSGQLADGVNGTELRTYGAALEEARADLFGLYYLGDEKLVELGLIPTTEVAKAQYAKYIMNGMMTQFTRIELGKSVEQAHMRNRKLIAEWCYAMGNKDNVIEWVKQDGKSYVVVNDFDKLRGLFAQMLHEIQRIKSEGDYEAGRNLVETYAVHIDPELHAEVLERNAKLQIEPYGGFVNPEYTLVERNGEIVDVEISYPANYTEQMLELSHDYSVLPNIN